MLGKMQKTPCKWSILFVFLLAVSLPGAGAVGEEVFGKNPLSLKECLQIALQRSPQMMKSDEALKGARALKRAAITEALPKGSLDAQIIWLDEDPEFEMPGVGDMPAQTVSAGEDKTEEYTVSFTQPVFTGGAVYNAYVVAKKNVEIAETGFDQTRQNVVLDTVEAYINQVKTKNIFEVSRQSVEQVESQVKKARDFFEEGIIALNDLLTSEVRLSEVKRQEILAESGYALARSQLQLFLMMEEEVEVGDLPEYLKWEGSMEEALDLAYKNRPQLNQISLRIEQAEKMVRIAQSDYLPRIFVAGNYTRQEGGFSSVDEQYSVLLGGEWTFWEWGKSYFKVSEAKSQKRELMATRKLVKNMITLEVKKACLDIVAAEKMLDVAKKSVEQAEENFRVINEKYEVQLADSTEVLDALTSLSRAQTSLITSEGDRLISMAKLKRSIGLLTKEDFETP